MKKKSCQITIAATLMLLYCPFAMQLCAQTASYSYDSAGRLRWVAYSNGASIQYEYDPAGNITKIIHNPSGPPPKATLISPSGSISTNKPAYKWNAAPSASYYQLYVNDSVTSGKIKTWYTASEAGCSSGTNTCSVTPSVALANGDGKWWIQTWSSLGDGPWSDEMSFNVAGAAPGKAVLVSPSGSISTTTPTYTWNAVAASTWYYLWVNDNSTGSGKIQKWYSAEESGCGAGTGNCSVTPSTVLSSGAAQWWIQTWNDNGYGPWSDGMTFTVGGAGLPGKATLISPGGTIASPIPAYSWNAVSSSTWYYLWVSDESGSTRIQKWYTAEQAGCASGAGTCSVTSTTALGVGSYQWWIQTWNDSGYGPWSDGMRFSQTAAAIRSLRSTKSRQH